MLISKSARAEKTWSAGSWFNAPSISTPVSGAKFGMSTTVDCSCNEPNDSDHWVDGCDSGDEPDAAVKATWSDGDADGSWVGGINTGTSVKYITPSSTGPVELTVTFDDAGTTQWNDEPPRTANVTIEVVNAKMIFKVQGKETSSITRCGTGSFEVVDGSGKKIKNATYSNWKFDGQVNVYSMNTASKWSGTIVEPGTASCTVTFGGTICTVSKTISVNPRSGWSITPGSYFNPDNDLSWGSYPGQVQLGKNQDEENESPLIIWPRGDNFSEGCTRAQVTDGPNKDVWYISSCTFNIARETLINKYAKSGTTGYPDPPNENWHEFNERPPQNVDADGCLQGARNHEAYGTGGNRKGHQALIEDEEAKTGMDAKTAVEDKVAYSDSLLKSAIQNEAVPIDLAIWDATSERNITPGDNWGASIVVRL